LGAAANSIDPSQDGDSMYKAVTLFSLVEQIDRNELFLPHIQRPFVWDEEQMVRLFDSLMRNYPIQTFLFWRTKEHIKARDFMKQIEWDCELSKYYNVQASQKDREKVFVLDGQQRLQTLYAVFSGSIDGPDGATAHDAYLDVTNGAGPNEDGLLYSLEFKPLHPGLPYYRLRDLVGPQNQKNAEEISQEINDLLDGDQRFDSESPEARRDRQRRVRRNLSQLASLLREEKHLWVQTLDGVANEYKYRTIRDIFVRVNSGGTKLDAADLMFAVMKEFWEPVEELVEQTVEMLNGNHLMFDKNLVLKCIVSAISGDATVDVEKFSDDSKPELLKSIEANWAKLEDTFKALRDFIVNDLKLYGDKTIRSYNSFVPLFDFLYYNPGPDAISVHRMKGYFYKSQLFNWYRAQTDAVINGLHKFVGKKQAGGFPLAEITEFFRARNATTVLELGHLKEIRLRFILLNVIYVEKFGNAPFDVRYSGNDPEIDHIYPKSMLYSQLQLGIQDVNHLGNYRYVGAHDNLRKRAELPDSYFGRLKDSGVDVSKHLLIQEFSERPAELKFDLETYRRFRDSRLEAIYQIASRVVNPEITG
jgi:hypothetical protein